MKSKKILIIVLLGFLQSCVNNNLTPPEENLKGNISIQLDKQNAPKEVNQVVARLSRINYSTITQSIYLSDSSNSTSMYFDNLEIGIWNINVDAINSDGIIIYTGQTSVEVKPGATTPITLQLNPTKGSILLMITWPSISNYIDYNKNPILTRFNNQYDDKGIAQSIIFQSSNKFLMWYTGLSSVGSYIFYAESEDGIKWNRPSNSPVIYPSSNEYWDSRNVYTGPVLYENSLFKMYYAGRNGLEGDSDPWFIGLAVSQNGLIWEKHNSAILSGSFNSWDLKIVASDIKVINGKYYLYYTGKNDIYDQKIGVAISTDGINWEKYSGNPILVADKEWEGSGIYHPSIIEDDNNLVMVYQNTAGGNISGFGIAYSADGLNWIKDNNNPIFTSNETNTNVGNYILYPNIHKINNEFRIYYTNYFPSSDDRNICVASKTVN
jgi:predicted GH43/DUF377 family glycosyl hydrolase